MQSSKEPLMTSDLWTVLLSPSTAEKLTPSATLKQHLAQSGGGDPPWLDPLEQRGVPE